MATVRLVIDGTTLMDAQVSLTQGALPDMNTLRSALENAAGGQFQPWQLPTIGALSATLLDANTKGVIVDTTITVTTRGDGWTLDVNQG